MQISTSAPAKLMVGTMLTFFTGSAFAHGPEWVYLLIYDYMAAIGLFIIFLCVSSLKVTFRFFAIFMAFVFICLFFWAATVLEAQLPSNHWLPIAVLFLCPYVSLLIGRQITNIIVSKIRARKKILNTEALRRIAAAE